MLKTSNSSNLKLRGKENNPRTRYWIRACSLGRTPKKQFDVISDCIQNEAISLVVMRSKRIVGLVKENHATTKLDWKVASRGIKIYSESRTVNLKENVGKVKSWSVFVIKTTLWTEKLGCFLENSRGWKNALGKLVVLVNTGSHSIRGFGWKECRWLCKFVSFVIGDSIVSLI